MTAPLAITSSSFSHGAPIPQQHVADNVPATATGLTAGTPATGAANSLGGDPYLAPAPPPGHGDHFYYFELYALRA
jgi:phosphatidylethanolamine-binding protein (PEBP) family uncharacterized protein